MQRRRAQQQSTQGDLDMPGIVAAARALRAQGFGIAWLAPGEKNPTHEKWTLASQEPGDYQLGFNLGILTGRLSGDLVDIDLDSKKALDLADKFLPFTGMVEGRPGKPLSPIFHCDQYPGKINQHGRRRRYGRAQNHPLQGTEE